MSVIRRQDAIDTIHSVIFDFFDIVEDDCESPITYKDEKLLELNKAITQRIRQLPSAQSEDWMERNKERILQAGMEGREVEFRIGGRLFAIREKAQ